MKKYFVSLISLFILCSSVFPQLSLENDIYKEVTQNVFEVVIEKHEDTKIVYEKELPLERVPFAIRNDKYTPIGTAFLLKDGAFYTAAHVLNLYGESIYDKFFIRDNKENVYEIDQILSFSQRRDFVKFSVKGFKSAKGSGLDTSNEFEINSTVFSVGNALGEGIVIRNGSLTSQTFEQKNGEWKWLRFSAAASPGNSGGPLITPNGKVIGIITMKSENENLNYALPIKEVFSVKENTGLAYLDYKYRLPNILNYAHPYKFEAEISLPKSLSEVNKTLTQLHKKNILDCLEEMKKEYDITGSKCFDKSAQADEFFMRVAGLTFPLMLYLNQSGTWDYAQPSKLQTYNLEDNGFVEYGAMVNYYFARIHKPDSLPLSDLINNPKISMDYLTKPFNLYRNVYGEQVNILSFGDPEKTESYKDYFGRTWYVSYYAVDFADSMILTFTLPIPTGVYIFATLSDRDSIKRTNYLDSQFMADFMYPRYGGKLKFWREYLSLPKSIRGNMSDSEKQINMTENKKEITFDTGDIKIKISKKDVKYNDESAFVVRTGYTKKGDKVIIENKNLVFTTSTKEDDYKYISVLKIQNPGKDAKESLIQNWKQFVNQVSPYNNEPYSQEQYTYLDKIIYPSGYTKENAENADYLYIFSYEIEGQNKYDEIKKFAEKIEKGISVK